MDSPRAENRLGFIDHGEMYRRTQTLLERLGIDLDPEMRVGELSVASRQMVEIAKAVSYDLTFSSWTNRRQR